MDIIRAIAGRLIIYAILFFPLLSKADDYSWCPSMQNAYQYCLANFLYGPFVTCRPIVDHSGRPLMEAQDASGTYTGQAAPYASCSNADRCKSKSPFFSIFNGNQNDGICDDGCGFAVDMSAGITITRNASGASVVAATWKPTGATCDGSGGGATNDPPPNTPQTYPPKPTVISKPCGGGSCYDPGTDQFCATSGGQQFCVPGSQARTSGGCASSGDATLCVGSPPPAPPNPPIADPATQIRQQDTYTQQTNGGPVKQLTTNIFTGSSGTQTSSGQGPTDSGPAPASTVPAKPGSYGDGGDCNIPPVCSGDAVLCGIARETWRNRCSAKTSADQARKDLVGDGTPPGDAPALGRSPSADGVWSDTASTGDSIADAANRGEYDQSGLGFASTCPLHDMSVSLPGGRSFAIQFGKGCELGGWLRAIVIAFAFFAAARITAGGSA